MSERIKSERINFGKLKEVIQPLDFLGLQFNSYQEFLQQDVEPDARKKIGLEAVFKDFFPIESYDNKCRLEYVSYRLGEPKLSDYECIQNGLTYGVGLYVTFCLKTEGNVQEEEIYMGELPMMTSRASFVINGAERVVVSQLHRSPGICFEQERHFTGKWLQSFRIIPDRGTWVEVQFDPSDLHFVYLDRRRRRYRFLVTTFLRALGFGTNEDLLKLFYKPTKVRVSALLKQNDVTNLVLTEDILDVSKGLVLARSLDPVTKTLLKAIQQSKIDTVSVVDASFDKGTIIHCLKKDTTSSTEEGLNEIFRIFHPGESLTSQNARLFFQNLFFDKKQYDLTSVGRLRLNEKLGVNYPLSQGLLQADDVVEATRSLCKIRQGEGSVDDIDFLGSRRVRLVGELVANQCRFGLSRMGRIVRERMSQFNQVEEGSLQHLLSSHVMITSVVDFFARSQLSQLADQINPLSEITHKRRLSALGPGGLDRERAGLEVRDVHVSHYGRICPIETPEGANIGLINSLTMYARVNEFGFIETPYRLVRNKVVTDEVHYLTAEQEKTEVVAQANSTIDAKGRLVGTVIARKQFEVCEVNPEEVTYVEVSPKQVISVAAGLIPFLEHDDASRALMGSNMLRQAVPLLRPQAPLVGTGLEEKVAKDSRALIFAKADGKVASVTGSQIVVTADGSLPIKKLKLKTDAKKNLYVYPLRKFARSNAATCFNGKALVSVGDNVKAGQVLADGGATDQGEIALGSNVLVAYMPWHGYNYEDAVILSERIVKEDVFTSIHIEEYEIVANDTKLGMEEITCDIPNVGKEALKNLDRRGIICIGSEVHPGDILVGKITPKGETELSPEEKLLRAIFGEKASDVKNSSLIAPSGCAGYVMDVQVNAQGTSKTDDVAIDRRRQEKKMAEEYRVAKEKLRESLTEALSNVLLGEKIPLNVVHVETGEVIVPANRKITKTSLRSLAFHYDEIQIEQSPVKLKIVEIIAPFLAQFEMLEKEHQEKIRQLDEEKEDTGVIKSVRVMIAVKRKIKVGDKMAGRHGNKGVVSCIVPVEDMPFLEDGTPVDIILNPLGVPARMNIGQILETHFGWACKVLGVKIATPVFDGASQLSIKEFLKKAKLPENGKVTLYDGCTGEPFHQTVTIGYTYMMKLNHLVDNKVHARATGPYSLITQQPLGGKAQFGGQRFGEMEVWALESYGAAYSLQEMLTVKSDDVQGRTRMYESIVKGNCSLQAGIPQSFNVLVKEIQGLGLDLQLNTKAAKVAENEYVEE